MNDVARRLGRIAGLVLALTAAFAAASCGNNHRYDRVDAITKSLRLDSIGPTTPCLHHSGASFSGVTICQTVVSAPQAADKVEQVLGDAGYQHVFTDPQYGGTTWRRSSGKGAVEVTVNALQANDSYSDLDGKERTVEHEGAIVTVKVDPKGTTSSGSPSPTT